MGYPGRLSVGGRRCAQRSLAHLRQMFGGWVELPEDFGSPARDRIFTPHRTFWLFLSQILDENGCCREALRRFQAWLHLEEGRTISPSTAGYCTARGRLRLPDIQQASGRVADKMERLSAGLWCGRRVKVVDGTGLSMPDTPNNQEAWPQPKGITSGCGFPLMRAVVLFSLASGAILDLAHGAKTVAERTLARRLWGLLAPGDVLLGDRGFCGFADFYHLSLLGVDCVTRKHSRRKNACVLKRLGRGDRIVAWKKSGPCPKWMDAADWRAMPDFLVIREVEVSVSNPGFRTQTLFVVTTLLDPQTYPASSLSGLYLRRWRAELFLRDIKVTLGIDVLRCLSREMIEKELWMAVTAYNLIRALMLESARLSDSAIERMSFAGTVAAICQWSPVLALPHLTREKRRALYESMIESIARDKLPDRPGRREPRAKKRRPKNYQLLNSPRRLFREKYHWKKCKIALT